MGIGLTRGGASPGDVDPDLVDEPLVSDDDFTKPKGLFCRVYSFTIVSYSLFELCRFCSCIVNLLGCLNRTLSRGLGKSTRSSSLPELCSLRSMKRWSGS